MENPFAEKLALLNRPDYGRLSFEEQCGFYAALILRLDPSDATPEKNRRPIPPEAVAKVAGVTRGTVSLLCGRWRVSRRSDSLPQSGARISSHRP